MKYIISTLAGLGIFLLLMLPDICYHYSNGKVGVNYGSILPIILAVILGFISPFIFDKDIK